MKKIIKIILMTGLIIGGCTFIVLLPKLFVIFAVNVIESLGGLPTEDKIDENGNIIHQDDRHTLYSFGNRKQFSIEKCGATELSVYLFDRDKNKEIDEIKNFTLSSIPDIYTFGKNGYTKLNYEKGEVIQSKNITDFSVTDQKIFKNIESHNYVNELNGKKHKRQKNS